MAIFEITYVKHIGRNKPSILEKVQADLKIRQQGNQYFIDLGYGLNPHYINCTAKDPGMPTERYRLHKSIYPTLFREIKHIKSGRTFRIKNHQGFVHYTAELVEDDKTVAIMTYEDYYKD